MKLAIQLLDSNATLNVFKPATVLQIAKGQTALLVVRLFDAETGERYVPISGATLKVDISRFAQYFATDQNVRETRDYTITGFASNPYPSDDRSLWSFPLTAVQTATITSSAVRFTLTQSTDVKIATVPMLIQASNLELN